MPQVLPLSVNTAAHILKSVLAGGCSFPHVSMFSLPQCPGVVGPGPSSRPLLEPGTLSMLNLWLTALLPWADHLPSLSLFGARALTHLVVVNIQEIAHTESL